MSPYSSGSDVASDIAVDSVGNAYVTGTTSSSDFPKVNAKYPNLWGNEDAFVVKFNATGSKILYSTYLGGSSSDYASGIAVDSVGNAYVTGTTSSSDFPKVNAKYPNLWGGDDAFVVKFNATGSKILYSTYLGGSSSDYASGIASVGNAYVTGQTASSDFPVVNAKYPKLWGIWDAFVFKLSSDGQKVFYSTYLGGSNSDNGLAIAVDGNSNAYVTGMTSSSDFPKINAIYPSFGGDMDAFVFKLSSNGQNVYYSTYLGGSGQDYGLGIAVDNTGNAYVIGSTNSSDFPKLNSITNIGNWDAFVFKLSNKGQTVFYSTYLGGTSADDGYAIAVDNAGNAYVTGSTYSSNFPTHANDTSITSFDSSYNGSGGDAFVAKLSIYGISVAKKGTGAGTVISNPLGIDCGTQCAKAFLPKTSVTLTATPNTNSHFVRWEGGCIGTQTSCTLKTKASGLLPYSTQTKH